MHICPTRWPGSHLTLGHWASVASSVFLEGADKPPLSCIVIPVGCVKIHSLEQRRMNWAGWGTNISTSVKFTSTMGCSGQHLVKALGNALVERTWPGFQFSCRGSMRLSTVLGTENLGSRFSFACFQPETLVLGSLIFLQGLLATVGCCRNILGIVEYCKHCY